MRKFFITPDKNLLKVPIDESFPEFIRDNQKLLSEWIL